MGENIVGKGEIACYEQFLLFPQCFQKMCTADTYIPGVNPFPNNKDLRHASPNQMASLGIKY